jgi:Short C-terminal domain
VRVFSYAFPLFFIGLGIAFAVLAYLGEPAGASLTFWIMAASFVGSGLLVLLVTRSARRIAERTVESSVVVSSGDQDALEHALRQALTLKGVTGPLQDEAVQKALAAAASGASTVDLREYTRPGEAHAPAAVEPAEEPAADPVQQLERLAKLRDSGVLSEGEFAVAKAKLLADL